MIHVRYRIAAIVTAGLAVLAMLAFMALTPTPAGAADSADLAFARDMLRNCQLQLPLALTTNERNDANRCISREQKLIAALTSASPSPTSSTSASPTATASPSPTATVSPSPTTTGPVSRNNCMPTPSACGFPDATNTGVPANTPLTVRTGKMFLGAGASLVGVQVNGCIQITGPNVLILNVRVKATPGCSYASIDLEDNVTTGARIENVEIDMSGLADTAEFTGRLNQRAITGDDFTARRVWWHGGSDCVHYGSRVVIEDSFCDVALIPVGYPGDPHIDGFQSAGGSGVTMRHNTIRNPNDQTSAIINGTTPGVSAPQFDVHIIGNLMAGGGWTVYCNAHNAATSPTAEFRNNRISRRYFTWPIGTGHPADRGGFWGPTTDCTAVPGAGTTVWDEDGSPLAVT